ncbi:3'-5' exonuclease domain-containing protein 2 [Chitinibacter fontanus]|uniref:3'-5' exonuclease n=1 Tax=Chitinibacter fontanus TaxID=1737446 RepID=A0A7D5ZIT7_9NEIS|nr:3'-5' exonuclease [Chitinibacter fontanus]QLI82609.1 3'-5' exonuclease domain-containing protein 2 [Chitinibacter fontanus]
MRHYPPSKEQAALFPPFAGLELSAIVVPQTAAELAVARADLLAQRFVGFDTESKPVFRVGEVPSGPHVVQLATMQRGYIFQLSNAAACATVGELLSNQDLVKVGFGLQSDRADIRRNLGVELAAVFDLDVIFRRHGYSATLGAKSAVALILRQRFSKSKRVSTSNWASAKLQDNQLLYAANDAYAAIQIFNALKLSTAELRQYGLWRDPA